MSTRFRPFIAERESFTHKTSFFLICDRTWPNVLDKSTHRRKPVHYTTKSKNKTHDANSMFDEQRRNDLNGHIRRLWLQLQRISRV